jgi:protein SCO1/2
MDLNKKKTILIAFIIADVLLAILLVYLFVGNFNRLSDEELRELGATVYPDPREISSFQLTDHRGNSYTQDALAGSWTLIFFGYTACPDICPLTMSELDRFYQDLESSGQAQDTNIVLATVDPLNDSPQKMADYVSSFHEDFIGLTGDPATLQQLAGDLYVIFSESPDMRDNENDHMVNHSAHISVIDPNGNYHSVMRAPHRSADLGVAYAAIRKR